MLAERHDRDMAATRAALGQERFSHVYEQGRSMPVEQVITDALHGTALS
jgi:hypothetical protein